MKGMWDFLLCENLLNVIPSLHHDVSQFSEK